MTGSISKTKSDDAESSIGQRFPRGADAVFDEVIERYSHDIQRLAYRLLAWDQEVDDVVQDVFVAAFVNRKKFRAGSSLKHGSFPLPLISAEHEIDDASFGTRF